MDSEAPGNFDEHFIRENQGVAARENRQQEIVGKAVRTDKCPHDYVDIEDESHGTGV